MIAALEGIVISHDQKQVVMQVGGVFYQIHCGTDVCEKISVGKTMRLWTIYRIREQEAELFGFENQTQKALALKISKIQGVGLRKSVDIIGTYHIKTLLEIIAGRRVLALEKVSGIGKRIAKRIVEEMPAYLENFIFPEATESASVVAKHHVVREKMIKALVGLEYPRHQATETTETLLAKKDNHNKDLSLLLKEAIHMISS